MRRLTVLVWINSATLLLCIGLCVLAFRAHDQYLKTHAAVNRSRAAGVTLEAYSATGGLSPEPFFQRASSLTTALQLTALGAIVVLVVSRHWVSLIGALVAILIAVFTTLVTGCRV